MLSSLSAFFLSRVGHRRLGSLGREYMGTPA